jgi:hypothetical protein
MPDDELNGLSDLGGDLDETTDTDTEELGEDEDGLETEEDDEELDLTADE